MHILWSIITGCFKWAWRLLNFIREGILNLLVFSSFLFCIYLYLDTQTKDKEVSKGALLIDISGIVVDQTTNYNIFNQLGSELLGSPGDQLQENSLFKLVDTIRQAKTDENITGIVLSLKDFAGTDQPSLQYIGKALKEFRDSGKPIYAVDDSYNQTQYYLASFANKIYLSPYGDVSLHGFVSNNLYYKSLLDNLKVTTNIFRVGTYKSAVEPLMRDNMSPEAREANKLWVNGLWENYLNVIATNRQLSPRQMFPDPANILANLQASGGDIARYALDNKLVDQLASRPIIESDMAKAFGWNKQSEKFNSISMYDYQLTATPQRKEQIAVIFAQGEIIDGVQTASIVGGDTIAKKIRQARLDPKIKALILRVNSPGGSLSASEVIRAELATVRNAGKPIVVSMGGTAASGGYWISTPANYIIASPSTLTGSIGVFGVVQTFENTLGSIGIYADGVATSALADASVTKVLPDQLSQIIQMSVENGYKNFIELVATSRHKTPEQINQIAQGRVWTGADAKSNGLVDQLGDFDHAVEQAVKLAQLKSWQLNWYVEPSNWKDKLFNEMSASVHAMLPGVIQSWLPAPLSTVTAAMHAQPGLFNNLNDPQHRYAICLTCGDVR